MPVLRSGGATATEDGNALKVGNPPSPATGGGGSASAGFARHKLGGATGSACRAPQLSLPNFGKPGPDIQMYILRTTRASRVSSGLPILRSGRIATAPALHSSD